MKRFRSWGLKDKVKPEIKRYAREMRHNPTPAEKLLWSYLFARQIHGVRFRRQYVIRGYIADFYCPRYSFTIELDGHHHATPEQAARDAFREDAMRKLGIDTIRFTNDEVLNNTQSVVDRIKDYTALREKAGVKSFATTHFYVVET